jgi:23S rRNA U2552 (ribose-2'-O)-methylase RlmE/FtsJ
MMWVLAKVQARRNRLVTDSRTRSLTHKGLRALSIHRLEKLEEKYQMLKVI